MPVSPHAHDSRVRVVARPKAGTGKAPIVIDVLLLANRASYRLIDVDVDGSRFVRDSYKQFDRTLTSPGEGYPYLVSRLRKKLDRGTAERDAGADSAAMADPNTDASPPSDEPAFPKPAPKPPTPPFPWFPVALGSGVTLAFGLWLGRRSRKGKPPGTERDANPRS
jgi:hypothetical protein